MTRQEHLVFCKVCTKRKTNLERGIVCSLTGEHADFEETCPSYELDQEAKMDLDRKKAAQAPMGKEEGAASVWTLLVGLFLTLRGFMRIFQDEFGIFGVILTGMGLVIVGGYLWQLNKD